MQKSDQNTCCQHPVHVFKRSWLIMLMEDCHLQSYYSHYSEGQANCKADYCEEIYSEISSPTDNGTDSGTTKTVADIYFLPFPSDYSSSKAQNSVRRDRRHNYQGNYNTVRSKNPPVNKDRFLEQSNDSTFLVATITFALSCGDLFVDTFLCYLLYKEASPWAIPSGLLLLIASLLVNMFSVKWYIQDRRGSEVDSSTSRRPKLSSFQWLIKVFSHLLLLGHIFRYLDLLYFAYKSHNLRKEEDENKYKENYLSILQQSTNLTANHMRSCEENEQSNDNNESQHDYANYYILAINEDRDAALLSLIKSFSQSVEMVLLQSYIIASNSELDSHHHGSIAMLQLASIITSLVYTSWSLACYHRALRRSVATKRKMNIMGVLMQFLWRFFTLSSRLVSIALFVTAFSYWILPIAIGHWGIMTIWVMHQGTHFCRNEQFEYLFNMIIGTIYLFCFLNIKDEPTRYKYAAYYVIVIIENTLFAVMWHVKVSHVATSEAAYYVAIAVVSGVLGAFFAGIVFMLIYYRFFHPNGKPLWSNKAAKCC